MNLLEEYLRLEEELMTTYQAVASARTERSQSDDLARKMSQMMARIHCSLLPRMEALRAEHAELAKRALPQRLKTPGEISIAQSLERVDARREQILEEGLPVRIVAMPDGDTDIPWAIEDAESPYYLLEWFNSETEAKAYLLEHKLPLARED